MKYLMLILMLGMFGVTIVGCEADMDDDGAKIEVGDT